MRIAVALLAIFVTQQVSAQPVFQLAPPMLKYHSGFFNGSTSFEVIFDQPGAEVHYTLNGKEPTKKDPLYSKAVPINKRTVVKAKAFGNDFTASETVTAHFINQGKPVKKISFSKPNESYAHAKADILNDNIGGMINYRAGSWLGYDNDTVTIDIELLKKEKISSVLIDLLQDENSWIFLPEQIMLFYYDDKKKAFLPAGKEVFTHESKGPKQCNLREIEPRSAISTQKLKLIISPLKKIPDWHNGKGNHGWLFIDEIKVY
jgi:hypothetical protein